MSHPRSLAVLALVALVAACRFDARGSAGPAGASDRSILAEAAEAADGPALAFPDAEPMQQVGDGMTGVDGVSDAPPIPDLTRDLLAPDTAPTPCGKSCVAGCCAGEQCRTGVEHIACGGGGKACVDCTALGQQCVAQACAAIPCTTTATCPADKVCDLGTCVSPYGFSYRIWVKSAVIDATNGGAAWDPQSGPDPYVLIKIGGQAWITRTRYDTLTPVWNQYVDHTLFANTLVRFEVRDEDMNGSTLIGVVELKPGVPATVLHTGAMNGSGGHVSSLKLGFERP